MAAELMPDFIRLHKTTALGENFAKTSNFVMAQRG